MPKSLRIPSYTHHKATGQARVRIAGRDHYLGPYGSEASRVRYGELIAQHAGGTPLDPLRSNAGDTNGITVNELCLAFYRHAEGYYVKRGRQTSELSIFRMAMKQFVALYGSTPVTEFGPRALKAVRAKLVESKTHCPMTINRLVKRIRHIVKWGVAEELVPGSVLGLTPRDRQVLLVPRDESHSVDALTALLKKRAERQHQSGGAPNRIQDLGRQDKE